MKWSILSGIASAICWAAIGTAAHAQAPPPRPERPVLPAAPVAPQPAPTAPATSSLQTQTHRAKNVLGTRVLIQGGTAVGTVDDIIFDDNGYIDYLVVLNDGKYFVVPWQAAKFNLNERTANVDISQQQYQQVPTFSVQTWPTFDATYRQRIYPLYNLNGRERRIERREDRRGP